MELSKHEMELFLLFPDLQLKNFFHKMFLNFMKEFKAGFGIISSIEFKTGFENRKWNYFSYFLTSNQKKFFYKMFLNIIKILKLVLKIGNGIIQTGNGIISLIS